jgi:hypothetical protein
VIRPPRMLPGYSESTRPPFVACLQTAGTNRQDEACQVMLKELCQIFRKVTVMGQNHAGLWLRGKGTVSRKNAACGIERWRIGVY